MSDKLTPEQELEILAAAAHCYQSAHTNGDCGTDGDAGRTDRPAG